MNRRLMATVASGVALLAVILAGIVFFQQPARSASSVPGTDLLAAATEAAQADAVKVSPTPTLTPIPEVPEALSLSVSGGNLATPIP